MQIHYLSAAYFAVLITLQFRWSSCEEVLLHYLYTALCGLVLRGGLQMVEFGIWPFVFHNYVIAFSFSAHVSHALDAVAQAPFVLMSAPKDECSFLC